MTSIARIPARLWAIVPVCACAYLAWSAHVRIERVDYVSGLAGGPGDVPDARSPTGYADGRRELVIPERNEGSFHWIEETQQMLARGELRVRHVDYENAPFGREVSAASPYRWWLGTVAWVHHELSGTPVGMSVERAALYADPLLQGLLVAGSALLVAWRFGGFAAAVVSVGLVGMFPFASEFLPGMPDPRGVEAGAAFASILLLLAGARSAGSRAFFVAAGIVGGLGLWISVPTQVPVILGIAAGALLSALVSGRSGASPSPEAWRSWAFSGGTTVLAAYLLEYFPGHMGSSNLGSVHPLYGLAWIGGGELLARMAARMRGARPAATVRSIAGAVLAAACVASVPLATWPFWISLNLPPGAIRDSGFLARDLNWARLTELPGGAVAATTWAWLSRDGSTLAAWATLLPVGVLILAAALLLRGATGPLLRASLALALGPAAVALVFACGQLGWWGAVDGAILAVLVALAAGDGSAARPGGRWALAAIVAAFAVPGLVRMAPPAFAGTATALTPRESGELVDRHLAHWLARRAGEPGVVVFAPPEETTTLSFFGGLRGIGTFAPDNHAGFGNSLAIAGVKTMEEAQADLQARAVRFVVIPSWDPFFDDFARLYLVKNMSSRTSFFVNELRHWNLPPWLRPVPYQIPVGGGFEGQSVLVFEVVDEQSPAAAAGRRAEYLVETGDLAAAAAADERLSRYPGDVGALAARAQVQGARGDAEGASQTLAALLSRLSNGGDRYLQWDRRGSLAVVLARAQRFDLARDQVRRCMADATEARLRSLSTGSLYDLLVLAHAFGLEIADPGLRDLALGLLPADLRGRL